MMSTSGIILTVYGIVASILLIITAILTRDGEKTLITAFLWPVMLIILIGIFLACKLKEFTKFFKLK